MDLTTQKFILLAHAAVILNKWSFSGATHHYKSRLITSFRRKKMLLWAFLHVIFVGTLFFFMVETFSKVRHVQIFKCMTNAVKCVYVCVIGGGGDAIGIEILGLTK